MFRKVPVGRAQVRFPVLSALPTAYFVTGDTGLKQTTEVNWANKFLNIEEIATIMPVPDNVIADIDANVWDEAMPLLTEASVVPSTRRCSSARTLRRRTRRTSWLLLLLPATPSRRRRPLRQGGFYGDLDARSRTVEADGFEANGFVASTSAKGKLRSARNSQGDRLDQVRVDGDLNSIDGLPVSYPMRGLWPTGAGTGVRLFAGDWSQFVLGVRSDITSRSATTRSSRTTLARSSTTRSSRISPSCVSRSGLAGRSRTSSTTTRAPSPRVTPSRRFGLLPDGRWAYHGVA
jgi:hypothetical protein